MYKIVKGFENILNRWNLPLDRRRQSMFVKRNIDIINTVSIWPKNRGNKIGLIGPEKLSLPIMQKICLTNWFTQTTNIRNSSEIFAVSFLHIKWK